MYGDALPAGNEPADPSGADDLARITWPAGRQIDLEEAIAALEDYAHSLGPDDEEGDEEEDDCRPVR